MSSSSKTSANRIECAHCSKTFASLKSLTQHLKQESVRELLVSSSSSSSDVNASLTIKKLKCSPCKKVFLRGDAMKRHLKSERHIKQMMRKVTTTSVAESSVDTSRSITTSPASNLVGAVSTIANMKCSPCKKRFARRDIWKRHMMSKSHKKRTCTDDRVCIPSTSSSSSSSSSSSLPKKEEEEDITVCEPGESDKAVHECYTCGQQFANKQLLAEHMDSLNVDSFMNCYMYGSRKRKLANDGNSKGHGESKEKETNAAVATAAAATDADVAGVNRVEGEKNGEEKEKEKEEEEEVPPKKKGRYCCQDCDEIFSHRKHLTQHQRSKEHVENVIKNAKAIIGNNNTTADDSLQSVGKNLDNDDDDDEYITITTNTAFHTRSGTYLILPTDKNSRLDAIHEFLGNICNRIVNRILSHLYAGASVKVNLNLTASFIKLHQSNAQSPVAPAASSSSSSSSSSPSPVRPSNRSNEDELQYRTYTLRTRNAVITSQDRKEIREILVRNMFPQLEERAVNFEMQESPWTFYCVQFLEVAINSYHPLKIGAFVDLPSGLKKHRNIWNIKSDDEYCFKYVIYSEFLSPWQKKHTPTDLSIYVKEGIEERIKEIHKVEFDFSGMQFPVEIKDIAKFEKNNSNFSINVFGHENNTLYPIRTGTEKKYHYDLLLLRNTSNLIGHLARITDLNSILKSEGGVVRKNAKSFCKRCLTSFKGDNHKEKLKRHVFYCNTNETEPARCTYAKTGEKFKFKNINNNIPLDYVCFGDFECLIKSLEREYEEREVLSLEHASSPPPPPPSPHSSLHSLSPQFSSYSEEEEEEEEEEKYDVLPSSTRSFASTAMADREPEFQSLMEFHQTAEAVNRRRLARESTMLKLNVHKPVSYCYYIVGPISCDNQQQRQDSFSCTPFEYVGEDAGQHFVESMIEKSREIYKMLNRYPILVINKEERKRLLRETIHCVICGKRFLPYATRHIPGGYEKKHIHHNHRTGEVIGVAHAECNKNARRPQFVPIFFHYGSKYDFHILLRTYLDLYDVQVIPHTTETYISFTLKISDGVDLRFVDSYKFLSLSLRGLTELLPIDKFIHTRKHMATNPMDENDVKFQLVRRKGIFPYQYLSSMDVLKDTALPPIKAFYDSLTDTTLAPEEYAFGQRVWNTFGCTTLEDYLRIYCKVDVLLLVDVFLSFRDMCLRTYNLDPCYYLTLPAYAFDAMKKMTGISLDLFDEENSEYYHFFEKSIRGGLTNTVCRYAKTNSKNISNAAAAAFDENEKVKSLHYWDANALYSWAMCQPLPTSNFKFLPESSFSQFTSDYIMSLPDDDDDGAAYGYFFEVDVDYPECLHIAHNEFPFLPEKEKCGSSGEKLLCTLRDKRHYHCHYRTLKCALQHGLKLIRIRKICQFKQSKFLQRFIDLNTKLRAGATSAFDKMLYKFMCNCIFGKTIESTRHRINFQLAHTYEKFEKLLGKPSFKETVIFHKDLVGVHQYKTRVKLNLPIYLGATILEVSKVLMYDFWYTKMSQIFGVNMERHLLYMDTDSFIFSIADHSIEPYILSNPQYFDCSDFDKEHRLYNCVGKKQPGLFKDELLGQQMTEFVSLAPKTYSYLVHRESRDHKRAKGVLKSIIDKELSFHDYIHCLHFKTQLQKVQKLFRVDKHEIFTVAQPKIALGLTPQPFAKRFFHNGIDSLAFGHFQLTIEQYGQDAAPFVHLAPLSPITNPL